MLTLMKRTNKTQISSGLTFKAVRREQVEKKCWICLLKAEMTTFIPFGDTEALSKLDAQVDSGEIAGVVLTPMDGHYKAEYVVLTPPIPKAQPEPEMKPGPVSEPANHCPECGTIGKSAFSEHGTKPVIEKSVPCEECEYPILPGDSCPICAARERFKQRHPETLFEARERDFEQHNDP